MAQKLRKDLNKGEAERMSDYNGLMKEIHASIKGIQKDVKGVQKYTAGMLDDLLQNRVQAEAEWSKMQDAMAQIRKTGIVTPAKQAVKKVEKKEVKAEIPLEVIPKVEPKPAVPLTLEQKVLDYINKHPKGVKISEMEEPLGETRMKLGFTAKALLDEGKVQKIDNIYFPLK